MRQISARQIQHLTNWGLDDQASYHSQRVPTLTPSPARPTCVDLFCGAGGFSEGFRQADFHTVAATDIEPWAGATFELNHARHGTKFILGDLGSTGVQSALLEAVEGIAIDVVIGGPPCQAFSQVRNHDRMIGDPRNKLYRHYVAMIRNIRPKLFVMENVPGLQNLGGGSVRRQILDDLRLDGEYRVAPEMVDAAAFGVPQNRLRVLFVGVRADLGIEPRFPEAPELPQLERLPARTGGTEWIYQHNRSLLTEAALSALLNPEDLRLVTVRQAIGDLAYLQPCQRLVRKPSDEPLPYETAAESAYQQARRAV